MKILLISPAFPPAPFAGSLRAGNVARAFAERGHDVHVITIIDAARRDAAAADGITVHEVRPHGGPKQIYRWLKSRLRRRAGQHPAPAGGAPGPADPSTAGAGGGATAGRDESVASWKRLILSLLAVPDDEKGFVLPAARRAAALGLRDIDLVYSTSPPHSAHVAGMIIASLARAKWVMEYRDPWNGGVERASDMSSGPARWLDVRLERLALRRADEVVAVSEGIRSIVERQSPRPRPVRVVRNGIDRIRPAAAACGSDGPFRILHIGTLYIDRDPRPFLDALALLRARRQLGGGEVEVHFAGRGRHFRDVSVEDYATAHGVGDLLRFTDWVPHEEARRLIDEADLLLLFAQAQPAQVPNKLYEYLGSRRPILALADENSETGFLLRQSSGHHVVTDFRADRIADALEAAFDQRNAASSSAEHDGEFLASLTTERQMAQLVAGLRL